MGAKSLRGGMMNRQRPHGITRRKTVVDLLMVLDDVGLLGDHHGRVLDARQHFQGPGAAAFP